MARDWNGSSQDQVIMNKMQEDEIETEMDDNDAGAVDVVVDMDMDTSISSRDGLLCTLLRLNVCCGPLFVLRKKLVKSYLIRNQNYLGITLTEYDGGFRRQGLLTDEEHGRVNSAEGLPLRVLDRRGGTYTMVLIQLAKTCRLRTGWGDFLRSSGVRQDDETHVGDVVEIWAFRSPTTGLGLVLLHYTKEEDAVITASLLERQEEKQEEDRSITTPSDSSSGSDHQEAQCIEEDQDEDQDDDKNCSPPLDNEVVQAAAILISMTSK